MNFTIVHGILVCSSCLISVCMFIVSKALSISSATLIVRAGGATLLNPFANCCCCRPTPPACSCGGVKLLSSHPLNRFLDAFQVPSQFLASNLTLYSTIPKRPSDSSRHRQHLLSGDVYHPSLGHLMMTTDTNIL